MAGKLDNEEKFELIEKILYLTLQLDHFQRRKWK